MKGNTSSLDYRSYRVYVGIYTDGPLVKEHTLNDVRDPNVDVSPRCIGLSRPRGYLKVQCR